MTGFGGVVRAEWTKFRSIRSSYWTLLSAAGLTIAVGLAFLTIIPDLNEGATSADPAREGWWYEGLHVGILAVMILGVLMASTEYATGTVRAMLAAVPSRLRVAAAKAVMIAAVTAVTGAIQAVAVFVAAQPILAEHGLDVPLTDPDAWRGVAMATLAMVLAGLFGLGVGLLVRHTAGAIGTVVGTMFVLGLLGAVLPASWEVGKFLPGDTLYAMFTPDDSRLAPGAAAAVFFAYTAVLLAAAVTLFHRRDAT